MFLGKLLKQERNKRDITLESLGKKVNKPHSQLSNYENGKTGLKNETAIDILVRGFDIPYSEARNMVAEFKIQEASKELTDDRRDEMMKIFNKSLFGVEDPSFLQDDSNWIPVYAKIEDGYSKTPPEPEDQYPIPRSVKQYTQNQLFYAKATDDSMSPTINRDDEMLILKEDFELEDGKMYIFLDKKSYIARKYKKITPEIAQLISDNPSFPEITTTPQNAIKCVGQILRVQKKFA